MRRYAPSQYRQVLLRALTAALYCISSPTTASTFALACCDDFCQRRAKLYLTYCKRAFGKPQSGKSAQQARANAYFFRRSVACIAIPRQDPLLQLHSFGDKFRARRPFIQPFQRQRNYRFASSVTALSHFAFAVQKSPRLAMYFQQPDVPGKFIRHSVPSSAMSCIQYTTSSARLSASDLTS